MKTVLTTTTTELHQLTHLTGVPGDACIYVLQNICLLENNLYDFSCIL